jgi:ferredoxin
VAARAGAGDAGIANIERFRNAPRRMHPANIFPDCRSVITIVQPIPRGTYRGITEGTHWPNYTFYAYNRLNTLFRPTVTYETACFIEDHGFEAVPVYPGVPETPGSRPAVRPDRPAPDINIHARIAAVACGLGEIGWSKVFIHPRFGPRVRLGTILTDAELEPDPLVTPGSLCARCLRCVRHCPGGAVPRPGDRPPVRIRIEDKTYEWGDVHMGRCALTHHGLNAEVSPFLKKDAPGLNLNVRETDMSEETAYKLTYPLAGASWRATAEFPSTAAIGYYRQMLDHVGYFAVCGARGCIRACMEGLENRRAIGQCGFPTPVFPCEPWVLPPPEADECGGVAEGRFPELYNRPDPAAGRWE